MASCMNNFKIFAVSISVAAVMANGAAAEKIECVKANDVRSIEVVAPGVVGKACDVRYVRGGGANVKTPYHANNSLGFCSDRQAEIVSSLAKSGFECATATVTTAANDGVVPEEALRAGTALAPSPAPTNTGAPAVTDQVVAAVQAPAEDLVSEASPVIETNASVDIDGAGSNVSGDAEVASNELADRLSTQTKTANVSPAVTTPQTPSTSEPRALAEQEIAPLRDGSEDLLAEKMSEILEEPSLAQKDAFRGPEPLAAEKLEPVRVNKNAPVGRLAGADPYTAQNSRLNQDEKIIATSADVFADDNALETSSVQVNPLTLASATQEAGTPEATDQEAANPAPSNLRDSKDIIKAVLQAQAAAWNEGNLQAYMNFYWKNDKLRFVADDGEVTKGWSALLRRNRKTYNTDDGFGRLSIKAADITLITDDVAVVTCRFNREGNSVGDGSSNGFSSMVMQRLQGVWRIVHDHSVETAIELPATP